jgi:hypothetical protein
MTFNPIYSRRFARFRKQVSRRANRTRKANSLQPETFEILFNLGQAYLRTDDYQKAGTRPETRSGHQT